MRALEWPAAAVSKLDTPARLPRRGPLVVLYHGIGGKDGVTVQAFEQQLAALIRRRRVVPLAEAVTCLGRPESAQLAAITFDDGYRDFAELASPILRRMGLHATLFVPTGWLGKENVWDRSRPRRAILSARELRDLDPETTAIGAHGHTHTRLLKMSAPQLKTETIGARKLLEDACARAVTLFAYPYGQRDDFDAAAEIAVEDAGFVAACSTRFGRGSDMAERFRLRRIGFGPDDSLTKVERKLDGAYDWLASKEALGAFCRGLRRRAAVAVSRYEAAR